MNEREKRALIQDSELATASQNQEALEGRHWDWEPNTARTVKVRENGTYEHTSCCDAEVSIDENCVVYCKACYEEVTPLCD